MLLVVVGPMAGIEVVGLLEEPGLWLILRRPFWSARGLGLMCRPDRGLGGPTLVGMGEAWLS
jgi:hypothetical protein